jgi:PAS domain S-box-containing protein
MASRTAHVAVGIACLRTGIFVEANESFCRLLLRAREDVMGRTAAELGMWPDPLQRQHLLDTLQGHGSLTRFEARYRNSRGEEGDVEVSARVVMQDGEPHMIAFLTEVTDRREFVEALRTAQARLGVLLRATSMLMFRQDLDLRYTWVANPALGASEADLLGRSDAEILGPEAAAPLVAIKRRVLVSGLAERRDVWVANNGQLACFDLVVEPDRDSAGRVLGILCAAQDITQRMTARAEPQTTPVNAIQGMSALMHREPLSPRQTERLKRIEREAERLARTPGGVAARQQLLERHAGSLVVVAEHNPVLRELLQSLLEQVGLHVAAASTGVEAFSHSLRLAPALLLLDMELPQSGGVAAARAIRSMVRQPLPILAMLSSHTSLQASRALDADLDDVLDKPVSAELLYEKLLSWLESP